MAAKKDKGKKSAPAKAPDLQKAKRKTAWSVRISIFLMLICALVFASSTLVFSVCMLPTLVAALIDKNPQKTLWLTIGSVNLAGTVPAWFALWDLGAGVDDALSILSDPRNLLVAYAAAAGGWIIHMNITPLIAALVTRRNEARIREIDKRQKELERKWGNDIARSIADS